MTSIGFAATAILIDAHEASFVHYAVGELRQQLATLTGNAPKLCHDPRDAPRTGARIVVGRAMAARMAVPSRITAREPGPQGFILRVVQARDGRRVIAAAGSDAWGTNYAVMHLRQLLAEAPSPLSLPADLDIYERPRYLLRGLYLHQHWRYRHPYATWSWSVEDWKRALDMTAHLRFNLVLLWPHMDMLAPPLSAPERDYLADIRAIVDYAQRKRGLKVWMVEPANVLLDRPAVKRLPLEERDYYAFAHMAGGGLKNPAKARDRASLRANRAAFIRAVPNADGYGFIDSDPGGWLGSPAREFVELLATERRLLNRFHERPRQPTVFHWALAGWGTGTCAENWRDVMAGVVKRVTAPRGFLACFAPQVEIARELDHLPQTLLFPYGVIDGEPSFPLTGLRFDQLQRAFDFMEKYKGLGGIIGNVQTFLVQLPNIFFTSRSCWQTLSARDALPGLARLLYPREAKTLAAAWAQLHKPGSAPALAMAARLGKRLIATPPASLGTVGQFVFLRPDQIATDLLELLRIHARAEAVRESPDARLTRALLSFLTAMLDWQRRNGFFGTYADHKEVIYDRFVHSQDCETVQAVIRQRFRESVRSARQRKIAAVLVARGYQRSIVTSMVGQLFGTYQVKCGRIEAKIFSGLPPPKITMPWTQPR